MNATIDNERAPTASIRPRWYTVTVDSAGLIEDRSAWGGGYGWTATPMRRPTYQRQLKAAVVVSRRGPVYLSRDILEYLCDMTRRRAPHIKVGRRKLWQYTPALHVDIVELASREPRNSREREVSKRNLSLARWLAGLANIDEEANDGEN